MDMKEIRAYLVTSGVKSYLSILGVFIVFFIPAVFIVHFKNDQFVYGMMLFGIVISGIAVFISYLRLNKQLRLYINDPVLQEELIKDFQGAEAFWDGKVLIGERNVYVKGGGIKSKADVTVFDYKEKFISKTYVWQIYYVSRTNGKETPVIMLPQNRSSENDVRDGVNRANELIRNE